MIAKKVLIVSHYYPPHHGGIEIVAQNQAGRLAALGHDVTVVTSSVTSAERSGDVAGVHVIRIKAWNFLQKKGVPFPLFSPRIFFVLLRAAKRADVVHIHDAFYISSFCTALAARLRGKPIVLTQHVSFVAHTSRAVNLIQRFVYATTGALIFAWSSRILTLNDRVEEFLLSRGVAAAKIGWLPNGVDMAVFRPPDRLERVKLRKKYRLSDSRKVVLFVGRFVPKKGFDKLLAAQDDAYQLVFAGGKTSLPDTPNVRFLGEAPQKVLAEIYRLADVFILPSESEGFPLTVQEAMASGLPVITTDDPGYTRYNLDRKLVYLLQDTQPAAIREALLTLVADEKMRSKMSAYSAQYAQKNFDWATLISKLDKIYDEVMTKAAPTTKPLVVTTSWDDGHVLDMRLAKLLKKYHVPATFYVSPRDHEFPVDKRLTDKQIKAIAADFEIGAHTMTHPRLTEVDDDTALYEMRESKKYLEKLLGTKITTFCYPGGNYAARHVAMAKRAGFRYARTVKRHGFDLRGSLLEGRTSVNTYNHYQDLWKVARFARFNPIKVYQYFHWDQLAIAMFDRMQKTGGVFHLWGHSWEVDGHGDWEKLENVLKHIAHRPDVVYATNGQLPDLQQKKVLVVAPYFPPHLGGQEFYSYNIAKILQNKYGWDVTIATAGHRGLRTRKTSYKGLQVYSLPYWLKISNTPYNPFWVGMFRRLLRREDITIVNTHQPVVLFGDMAARACGSLPLVVTYHMKSMRKGNSKIDMLIGLYETHVLPMTLARATHIICASDAVRHEFLQSYKSKSTTVTPGVDTSFFTPSAKLAQDTVLYVGSLKKTDTHKGVDRLLRAFVAVRTKRPSAQLVFVGAGDTDYFGGMAAQLQIADAVTFTGGLYGRDLLDAYHDASVFVLPSSNESFGMVIVEAMASGLPVVSTNVGAIPTIIEDGRSGYIIDPYDITALSDKITYLLDHPKIAAEFGKAARQKAMQNFDWGLQAAKTDAILAAALSTAKGPKA
jgi:D-inositol-3-phosphate glycosyltransferase